MGLPSQKQSDNDRQTAEDHKMYFVLVWPGLSKSQVFLFGWLINPQVFCFTNADPMRIGPAKKEIAMLRNFKVLLVALVVIAVAGSAYAFAAGNTVPVSAAGYTAKVVSGYTVTDIVYDLNAADPTTIDKITFGIDPSTTGDPEAKVVYLQTVLAGTWTTCDVTTVLTVTTVVCDPATSPAVADVTALNIVASSSLDPAP
jgi:hypothetical protein